MVGSLRMNLIDSLELRYRNNRFLRFQGNIFKAHIGTAAIDYSS